MLRHLKTGQSWLLTLCLLWTPAWAERIEWQPEKTRAVIAGVLSWEDASINTFPSGERKDQELYDTLLRRGVPVQNMTLLLDAQATHRGILQALKAQAAESGPDETFIFYYAGHGVKGAKGIQFLPYDYGSGAKGLSMSQISRALKSSLQSERTLLLADCCFSGGLAAVAGELESAGRSAASLTSANDLVPSVSNWTFTITLLDGLNGEPAADRDQNRAVTLEEMAQEVADAMLYHESQESGVSSRAWFSDLVMARSTPVDRTLANGVDRFDYVRFQNPDSTWETGRVVDVRNGNFVVEVQEYSSRREVEVVPKQLTEAPSAPLVVPESEARTLATVGGKYSDLLKKVEVEKDFLEYTEFQDYGFHEACSYGGQDSIPAGYWVYVYPNWYIWGKAKDGQ